MAKVHRPNIIFIVVMTERWVEDSNAAKEASRIKSKEDPCHEQTGRMGDGMQNVWALSKLGEV
jgi:hypothetical protein